ncbi:PD-(D/E)XK nuclease domain-containing protein, partial [Deltaproteobacteria bacterium TL4]
YEVRSNRESGFGRYDLLLLPKDKTQFGFVFEFKKIDEAENETCETALQAALQQIQDKAYTTELRQSGVEKILGIAVVVQGKKVKLKHLEL